MRLIILFWLVFVVFSDVAKARSEDFGPISKGVTPLQSLAEDDSSFQSLIDLGKNSSIVGMGEALHGSHDLHVARTAFVKILVRRAGYRAIGFEAPWQSSLRLNEYLRSCSGHPSSALIHLLFPAWFDEASSDLLTWLCEFNQAHPKDPVFVFGFDIQSPEDLPYLQNYLRQTNPHLYGKVSQGLSNCVVWNANVLDQVTPESVAKCNRSLDVILRKLGASKESASSAKRNHLLENALLSARSLRAFQEQAIRYDHSDLQKISQSVQFREDGMVWVFEQLRRRYFPHSKVVLYAHNWHIAKQSKELAKSQQVADSLGTILAEKYGRQYSSIGLSAYLTRSNPIVTGTAMELSPAPGVENSLEKTLHENGLKYAFVQTSDGFLRSGQKYNVLDVDVAEEIIPSRHYSMMFYLDYSAPLIFASGIECTSPFACHLK
jgi:erythromycin esterase-like protein